MAVELVVAFGSRQQRQDASVFATQHQRMVDEAVAVIIHVAAVEQERPVLAGAHEIVPRAVVDSLVALDIHRHGASLTATATPSLPKSLPL